MDSTDAYEYLQQLRVQEDPQPRFLQPTKSYKSHKLHSEAELLTKRAQGLRRYDTDKVQLKQVEKQLKKMQVESQSKPPRISSGVTTPPTPQLEKRSPRKSITPEPFELRSQLRHEVYAQSFKKQLDEAEQAETRTRQFRARKINGRYREITTPTTPPSTGGGRFAAPTGPPPQKIERKQVTMGIAPYITSEERLAARKALKEKYEQKEKEQALQKKQEEEERIRKEEEQLAAMRKAAKFQARAAPKFDKVWTPDNKQKAWELTKPKDFNFETQKKYGKPDKGKHERHSSLVLGPDGCADPLQHHLRS